MTGDSARLPPVDDYARSRFFAWSRVHPEESQDPSTVWAVAWRQSAWDTLRRSAQFAELIQRFDEFTAVYRAAEVEHEAEHGSPYWSTADVADEMGVAEP